MDDDDDDDMQPKHMLHSVPTAHVYHASVGPPLHFRMQLEKSLFSLSPFSFYLFFSFYELIKTSKLHVTQREATLNSDMQQKLSRAQENSHRN